ncbi:hypothetical protein LUZ60_007670 [Juncus effusus]|nr:hypothetical protein LUZ60_007670 [Juncus effusus]
MAVPHAPARGRWTGFYPPSMPWKLRLTYSFLGRVTDLTRRSDGTLYRRFLNAIDFPASASLKPHSGVRSSDLELNPSLKIRVFAPVDETADGSLSKRPILIFFHGGGFAYLSATTMAYDAVCRRFCRKIGAVVVSVDYRLSPEFKCPAQYDDGIEVMRYLDSGKIRSEAVVQGIELDFSSCFLIGDSAGGNISHHVARRYAMDKSSWKNLNLAGLITIQPFFGGEEFTESEIRLEGAPLVSIERTKWMWKAFLPAGSDRNHEAANISLSGKSESYELGESFPPVMVVVGGYDPLQDWQRRYYEMLKKKGKDVRLVEYPDAAHAFYVLPFPESKMLLGEIVKFVHEKRVNST